MDYCDCHAGECRLCGRQLPHTADQLFLIGLIAKADSGIPCGWMTEDEQRHLDSIRAAIVDCHAPQVPWTGLPVGTVSDYDLSPAALATWHQVTSEPDPVALTWTEAAMPDRHEVVSMAVLGALFALGMGLMLVGFLAY